MFINALSSLLGTRTKSQVPFRRYFVGLQLILELEMKVHPKIRIVSYSRPSHMIIASVSQFQVYLQWGQRPFSIVS